MQGGGNSWTLFLKNKKGQGYTMKQLSEMYKSSKTTSINELTTEISKLEIKDEKEDDNLPSCVEKKIDPKIIIDNVELTDESNLNWLDAIAHDLYYSMCYPEKEGKDKINDTGGGGPIHAISSLIVQKAFEKGILEKEAISKGLAAVSKYYGQKIDRQARQSYRFWIKEEYTAHNSGNYNKYKKEKEKKAFYD